MTFYRHWDKKYQTTAKLTVTRKDSPKGYCSTGAAHKGWGQDDCGGKARRAPERHSVVPGNCSAAR